MSKPAASLPCVCANLRRAARAVTQIYEEELRDTGLRATQLTLLQVLERGGIMTQGELGSLLCLDSTTLTRSLRPLIESGWVTSRRGTDKRERHLALSAAGRQKVEQATAAWQRAQNRVSKAYGSGVRELQNGLQRIAGALM